MFFGISWTNLCRQSDFAYISAALPCKAAVVFNCKRKCKQLNIAYYVFANTSLLLIPLNSKVSKRSKVIDANKAINIWDLVQNLIFHLQGYLKETLCENKAGLPILDKGNSAIPRR